MIIYYKDFFRKLFKYISKLILLLSIAIFLYSSIESALKYNYYIVDEVHYISASKLIIENFMPSKNWIWNYKIPDSYIKQNYLNLEHPPLGKYFIISSILLLGDYSISWRLPGIILGACIIFLVYLIGNKVGGDIAASISTLVILIDPMINSMSKVAMLDIYLAFFTTLAIYLLIAKKDIILASIASGLAISVKMNGIISLIIIILAIIFTNHNFLKYNFKKLSNTIKYLKINVSINENNSILIKIIEITVVLLIPVMIYLLINIPYILKYGFKWWLNIQFWMINVHVHFSTMHPCSSPPFSINPPYLNWLFNIKPFGLTNEFSASVNINVSILMILTTILTLISCIIKKKVCNFSRIIIFLWIWVGYIFYILLYILGRSMQFIYYLTPLMPAIDLSIGILPLLIIEFIR